MNGLENRIRVHACDLRNEPERLVAASYDRVVCNPPYHRVGEGKISADGDVAAARHELYCTLRDAVRVAADLLADHGRFCIVYPARRQRELLSLLREYALAPSRIRGVLHSAGRKASLCLTEAVKNGTCSCLRLPDLVQYDERGRLTGEMRRIYHMEESGSFGFSESPG
jgi:tRNA1(Val) A37 N6-methylase TrmN6